MDNHSDFSNSANNWVSKNIQHKIIWKHYAQMINPYVKRFYGVLPARVDFLVNMYGLPKEKVELLVMGVDDEYVKQAERAGIGIREQYGIAGDDFLIINGGKIDRWKPQTLFLMEAVNRISDPKVKLIVFGSVTEELRQKVLERCSDRVQYIGWVQSADSYKYFAAGNLAVFPGRHSVFWEQVAGQGIPMLVKYWNGTTHIDYGGNVRFLYKDSAEEIQRSIEETISLPTYAAMKKAAINAKEQFLYSRIAERSIR